MLSYKPVTIGFIATFIVAFLLGKYTTPEKIKTVTVEVSHQDDHVHKDTETIITKKPDGSIITDTKEVDRSDIVTDTKDKTIITKTPVDNNWIVGVQVKASFKDLAIPTYGACVYRRILGGFYIGGFGYQDGTIGVGAVLNF